MTTAPAPARRRLRFVLRLLLVLAVSALGLELGARWLLFGESELAQRLGRGLRRPSLFAMRWEDEYWALQHRFDGVPQVMRQADPVVGWRSSAISPGDLAHRQRSRLNGRRPVLMYGDSFTVGVTSGETRFEGLLERSELAPELCLLNYGVGGHGVDQMLVMLRATVDHWEGQDPLVVVGILISDDFDRALLSSRTGPKPWFELDDEGELVHHPPALPGSPPVDPPEVGIASYTWRWFTRSSGWLPDSLQARARGFDRHEAELRALNGRLVRAIQEELESRDLDHFFVLFHLRREIEPDRPADWREVWILDELDRLGIPYVSARTALEADMAATGATPDEYFIPMGQPGQSHMNERGNEVVFRSILDGLNGRFEGRAGWH